MSDSFSAVVNGTGKADTACQRNRACWRKKQSIAMCGRGVEGVGV